ncbi:MAG: DUF1080 domain-containing protein [Verrucomicrobiae bacterium]|jgi:hypothetical protein|nr:DUF1080 domain-containing protein [Verrucomicrobiae bacterium]
MSRFFTLPSFLIAATFLSGCATTEITTPRTETTYLRAPESAEIDFQPLFDGRSFNGWKLLGKKGDGYGIHDGILYCAKGGGGNLLTEKEYTDFVFRFEFRLEEGSNNGIAIRAPMAEKSLAYDGMELQILDNHAAIHDGKRRPTQYHGSLYDVAPAKRGALRPAGEWNQQEVTVEGRRVRVVLNGKTILDYDINDVSDPAVIKKHPGLFRESGHIGFLGHNDFVEFRNIRVKELPTARVYNRPSPGFELLFDGVTLDAWSGLSARSVGEGKTALSIAREATDIEMRTHWYASDNLIVTDGDGPPIVSQNNYGNVELSLEYRAEDQTAALVLLRGLPGIRLQGRNAPGNDLRLGSGGLNDGRFLYAAPTVYADRFAGAWNRLRVLLVDDRAHVFVNDQLVLKNAPFKNSGQPGSPPPASGTLGLFGESGPIAFRSIQARHLGDRLPGKADINITLPKTPPSPAPPVAPVHAAPRPKKPVPAPAPTPEPTTGVMKLKEAR